MAIIHVDESTPGLPNSGRLSGTNGDLVGIMDVALPLNGWAIEYTSGNARVYRPGSGNRFRLHMYDDSAVSGSAALCLVRGCENASDATTLVDPFPLVAQVANSSCNWVKSSAANTTARAFDIWVGETWVIYRVNHTGVTNAWECHLFGDFAPNRSGDSYNTFCTVRNSTSTTAVQWNSWVTNILAGNNTVFICRSYDGTVKSTNARMSSTVPTSNFGVVSNFPTIFSGPSSGIESGKVSIGCCGSTSTTPSGTLGIPSRGWVPNIRMPFHNGRQAATPNTRDTYTDTAYDPSFIGDITCLGNAVNNSVLIVESSDTWTIPSG